MFISSGEEIEMVTYRETNIAPLKVNNYNIESIIIIVVLFNKMII